MTDRRRPRDRQLHTKIGTWKNLQYSIYETTTSSLSFCLGSRAELTGAKWRIWDLLVGNLALLNVEFFKPRN